MIDKTEENVFEALDLPYHAKAADVLSKFHGMALTPAVTKELLSAIAKALEAERLEEREECAKISDEWGKRYHVENSDKSRFNIYDVQNYVKATGRGIAEDIRNRKG